MMNTRGSRVGSLKAMSPSPVFQILSIMDPNTLLGLLNPDLKRHLKIQLLKEKIMGKLHKHLKNITYLSKIMLS